jgi:hypothetical protein
MKTIYTSNRPDSDFAIVEVAGEIYAIDEDKVVGGWGKYHIDRELKFQAGFNEFISVDPDGNIENVDATPDECVFFGDFDFDDEAQGPDDLF